MNQKQLPAFPIPLHPGQQYSKHTECDGLTIRDYFAAKAMQALLSANGMAMSIESVCKYSHQIADAMLLAREST